MATLKTNRKNIPADKLVVDFKLNVRHENNYDVPQMVDAILAVGRITDEIHVRPGTGENDGKFVVLRGNRRTLAAQRLLNDPNTPQDVASELKKVACVVHDVTPGSPEEMAVVLDHGTAKGLSDCEVLDAVRRLDLQMRSEIEIARMLYYPLARFTGNDEKAQEAAKLSGKDRDQFLKSWLHGTLGNLILAAGRLTPYVWEQMRRTYLKKDRMLPEGVDVEIKMNRPRVAALTTAKNEDTKAGVWDHDNGGPAFQAKIQQLKDEDRTGEREEGKKRPTTKMLEDRVGGFKSNAIRNALLMATGDTEAGAKLVDLDAQLDRDRIVKDDLAKAYNLIADERVKELVKALLSTGPAAEVEAALKPFLAPQS